MTRWASLNTLDEARRSQLLQQAKQYYDDALALSPQNSVIRNELGNLLATLENDCQAAIRTYERSLEIDPYYAQTYYGIAGVYEFCASQQPPDVEKRYYQRAATYLEEALNRQERNAGALLLQAAQLYQEAEDYEAAIDAAERAGDLQDDPAPLWMVRFRLARIYHDMGENEQATAFAAEALTIAPLESQEEIRSFMDQLESP
jgi:tetratricopeptide (TPR) repeat protein